MFRNSQWRDKNISTAQILDALEILNRDFRKLNPDTATVDPLFQGIVADVEIEFVLATKALTVLVLAE